MRALRPLLALIGLTAVTAQVVLMRELLVLAGGAEISLGLVLGSWLLWTALGSGLLGRIKAGDPRRLVAALEVLIALVLPLTILAARAAKSAAADCSRRDPRPRRDPAFLSRHHRSLLRPFRVAVRSGQPAVWRRGRRVHRPIERDSLPARGRRFGRGRRSGESLSHSHPRRDRHRLPAGAAQSSGRCLARARGMAGCAAGGRRRSISFRSRFHELRARRSPACGVAFTLLRCATPSMETWCWRAAKAVRPFTKTGSRLSPCPIPRRPSKPSTTRCCSTPRPQACYSSAAGSTAVWPRRSSTRASERWTTSNSIQRFSIWPGTSRLPGRAS